MVGTHIQVQDAVAALNDGEHSFETTVKALADDEAHSETLAANCYFPSYVSTDKVIRCVCIHVVHHRSLRIRGDKLTVSDLPPPPMIYSLCIEMRVRMRIKSWKPLTLNPTCARTSTNLCSSTNKRRRSCPQKINAVRCVPYFKKKKHDLESSD